MRRALRLAACLAASSVAVGAAAQEATDAASDVSRFAVVGTTPQTCVLGEPVPATDAPAINMRTVIGRVVAIQDLVDSTTLSTRAASIDLTFDAVCNYPYQVTLESDNNGLFRDGAGVIPPAGFANGVPYRAELRWDDASTALDADALNRRSARAGFGSDDPNAGALTLRLAVMPGATNILTRSPLLAGVYRDTIRITLGPR